MERIQREFRVLPGQRLAFTQPIEQRVNEMISGVRTDVAVKLYGDDFRTLEEKAQKIETVLRTVPGNADLTVEQVTGQPVLQIQVKRVFKQ